MRIPRYILLLVGIAMLQAGALKSQTRQIFSGDPGKFTAELTNLMGPNLNADQSAILNNFNAGWDSTSFGDQHKQLIITIANQMAAKRMRPVPHFITYLETLMSFANYDIDRDIFLTWLKGLAQVSSIPANQLSVVNRFTETGGLLVRERIFFKSPSSTWKNTGKRFTFEMDTVFKIVFPPASLVCYSQNDSTIINETGGVFVPITGRWYGDGGTITWEKAGISASDAYATLSRYEIDVTKSFFDIDSVSFYHSVYFNEPVMGKLSDRAIKINNVETTEYPRFETYQKTFFIKDIYDNIDFEGGLTFQGSTVMGSGTRYMPSVITISRNDTVYVRVRSLNFIFNKESLNSQSTAFSLYLDKDSIFHSDIAFTYNVRGREVNTFRSRFPTSRSPYYSSWHKMDMYFEYLSWKVDEPIVKLSRARGASMGQAYFESLSYYDQVDFDRLMALDNDHPLYRLSRFAEWWYSKTFPIDEFAKWMRQPEEYATGMCIDLANKGFLYYDRSNDEVTIKQKLYDYINSYAKRQDYDVMSFVSETSGNIDNAILDMRNYKMDINGVPRIFLSDSQRVAIYPYDQSITLEQNRSFEFDGVVQAGMLTIFGHDFKFSYDTFKINLVNVDSMMLAVETDQRDAYGGLLARRIEDLIQMTKAELLIDDPNNKSGLMSLDQYPIFNAMSESYIFYDRIPGLEGVYPKSDFYFRLDPFSFENTDRLTESDLNLAGEFTAGRILPALRQTLSLQNDKSLGFLYEIPEEGLDIYEGNGKLHNIVTMSNSGMIADGRLDHLTSTIISGDMRLYPDSMVTVTDQFTIASNTIYPEVETSVAEIKWYPWEDELYAQHRRGEPFSMFDNGTILDGHLLLTGNSLTGGGTVNTENSQVVARDMNFAQQTIQSDTANYNLKSISGEGLAFIAEDANTLIDFGNQFSSFSLNTDSSVVKFPEVNYICTMTDFRYDMRSKILSMTQRGREQTTLMSGADLLKVDLDNIEPPTFFSTNMINDTLSFAAKLGSYLLQEEKVIAENVNYIKVADALIQPDSGRLVINKGARLDAITDALIAVNNNHIIHSANVDIIRSFRYTASGLYDYVDENSEVQSIKFDEIYVDSLRTRGTGHIASIEKFTLSPYFTFLGDVHLKAEKKLLNFLGSSGIVQDCDKIGSSPMKFNADIDPMNVMIPVSDKPRDINGNLITAGTYITMDSTHIYSAFLSPAKSWSDIPLVSANGFIIFDKSSQKYKIASLEKLANSSEGGSLLTFDRLACIVYSEGKLDLGVDYGMFAVNGAGNVTHETDSGKVEVNSILALDFHFSLPALTMMADEIRYMAGLKPVDLTSERYRKGMDDLMGAQAAATLREDMDLFGIARNLPKNFQPKILLNDVKLVWNDEFQSYRSVGQIGIGFIGTQAINIYVEGFVELQKRRSGDILDIYLKADNSTWYWFSYTRGVMMSLSGNNGYNTLLRDEKLNDRKHPDNSVRTPYTYMVGVQDRLDSFLRRMTDPEGLELPDNEF